MALRRDLVTRNSLEEALPRWVPRGLSVAPFTLAALLRDHSRKPLAELPRMASGRLGKSPIGCDAINRQRDCYLSRWNDFKRVKRVARKRAQTTIERGQDALAAVR